MPAGAARGQLELPDMPQRAFDGGGYSERDLARARADMEAFDRLAERNPGVVDAATGFATAQVLAGERCGVRWLGEQVRVWLADQSGDGFANGTIGVLARRVLQDSPWLGEFVEVRPCALDVVLGAD